MQLPSQFKLTKPAVYAIVGALAFGALVFGLAGRGRTLPKPAKAGLPVRTQTVSISPEAVSVTLTGEVKAYLQSDVSFRFAGKVASRSVDVGDHVKPGQILATLERTSQSADKSAALAGVEAAEATLKQLASAFDRQKKLKADGFTTQSKYDAAEKAYASAQASLDGAKSTLATAGENLEQTELRAEAAGIVVARNVEAGQVVEAAQAIYTIAMDGGRDAVFEVNEALLAKRPSDQNVELTLLSNASIKATGRVREISPVVDPASGTVRVKVGISNPPAEMGLGSPVSGVGRFQPRDLIVLPWTAIFTKHGDSAVWIVDPATQTASLRSVVVDSYRTSKVLVRSGLQPGDVVVTRGIQFLRPGQLVEPVAEAAAKQGE